MSVCLLEEAVRCRLRSGVALTSVAQCVGELVENSIDAEAKCVAVRVDLTKFKIQVIDNGHGITRKDLDLIGERYVTSKCHTLYDLENNLRHFGYRGEALASIADTTGTVEILSRHCHSQQTYSKMFYHGRASSVTQSFSSRPSVGTTVTLHDLFYNVPVRRKGLSEVLEIENIRHTLRGLALANPSISFSLRNDAVADCVMQIKRTGSLLGTFSALFGSKRAGSMKEACHWRGPFKISGLVSVESHYSKALQFVLVNGRLVKKTPLHTCINNVLSNSLICRNMLRRGDPSKWSAPEGGRDMLSPRRTPDKYGVYVLKLECPRTEYDICLEPAKTLVEFKDWDSVLEALREAVGGFLKRHSLNIGLENSVRDKTQNEEDASCGSQSCVVSEEVEEFNLNQKLARRPLSHYEPLTNLVTHSAADELDISDNSSNTSIEPVTMGMDHQDRTSVESSVLVRVPRSEPVEVSRCRVGGDNEYVRSPLHSSSLASKLSWLLQRKGGADVSNEGNAVDGRSGNVSDQDGKESDSGGSSSSEVARSVCNEEQRISSGVETTVSSSNNTSIAINRTLNLPPTETNTLRSDSDTWQHRRYGATFLPSTSSNRDVRLPPDTEIEVSEESECRIDFVRDLESRDSVVHLTCEKDIQPVDNHVDLPRNTSEKSWDSNCTHCANSNGRINANNEASLLFSEQSAQMSITQAEIDSGGGSESSSMEAGERDTSTASSSSSSSPWLEKTDPTTNRKIYIHKRTGKTSTLAPWKPEVVVTTPSNVPLHKVTSNSSLLVAGSVEKRQSSRANGSYGCRPLKAAPHLSFDFHHFAPSTKRLRMSGNAIKVKKVTSFLRAIERNGGEEEQHGGHSWSGDVDQMVGVDCSLGHKDLDAVQTMDDEEENTELQGDIVESQRIEVSSGLEDVTREVLGIGDDGKCDSRCDVEGEGNEVEVAASTWEEGSFEKLLQSWTNPAFLAGQQEILSVGSSSRTHIKVHNIIHGYKFTKEMFKSIQVLGQVDRKFIACMADINGSGVCDVVVLFDQHAAHERVRLEERLSELYESSGGKSKVKSSQVQPPLPLNLTPAQVDLCRHFTTQFKTLGVTLVHGVGGGVGVASVPAVLVQREASEIVRGRPSVALELVQDSKSLSPQTVMESISNLNRYVSPDFYINSEQELVVKHLEVLKDTSGGSHVIPASLTNILHSQACRSAVKFGDALSLSECQELIKSLSTCNLPFQCAHGRPSLVPILDLGILEKKYPHKVESRNLSKKLSKLYHHKTT